MIASLLMSKGWISQNADLARGGDQLGVLGAEIEDQDTVGVNVLGHGHLSLRNSKTARG